MPSTSVFLDYSNCLSETVPGSGLNQANLAKLEKEMLPVHEQIRRQIEDKTLGFWDLPYQSAEQLAPINNLVEKLRGQVDNLVVLGIGGSALGTTAVDMALDGNLRLALPASKDKIKIWVADNSDPRMFFTILNRLDPERTIYNVISKSGTTAETMSQFLVVLERLIHKLGKQKAIERIIFTTDPKEGVLRQLASREDFTCLEIPSNVGGRYSVLTSVGLFPLAMAGHDINELLAGARKMAERCSQPGLKQNPAYMFAALAVDAMRHGRNILVMMPYVTDLFAMAQWFGQLWGESLGKCLDLQGNKVNIGQTPVTAVGATDQHSQLQLYMEGPDDKLICFLTLNNYGRDLEIPEMYQDLPSLSYLGGHSMSELIQAEAKATATALAMQGRPSFGLRMPSLNANTLGQLLFLLEVATVAAGGMLHIDPLNQPGVELSKKLTYGLMGRKGYEQYQKSLDDQDEAALV